MESSIVNKGGRPIKKHAGGRPTVMTEETVGKLIEAFSFGCTDIEACVYAGICRDVLYVYQKENPKFKDQKEELKEIPAMHARRNWTKKIKEGDYTASKDYLERKKKGEFSLRQEITAEGGRDLGIVFLPLKEKQLKTIDI